MKKQIISFLVLICVYTQVFTQVAINTDGSLPDNSAVLDIKSTTQGLLIPKMNSAQRDAIDNPAQGLLIFQRPYGGFYYNAGSPAYPLWFKISATDPTQPVSQFWDITGNSATDPAINYIGTSDNVPLVFKVNSELAGKIETGSHNTSFGYQSHYLNIAGTDNVANGYQSLYSNRTGIRNTAAGAQSLYSIVNGGSNTAIGFEALYSSVNSPNTAIGANALYSNINGYNNTATGVQALYLNNDGFENSATGVKALYSNYSGNYNTADGSNSLLNNISGVHNTSCGANSLLSITGGSHNTAIGSSTMTNIADGNDNTAIGFTALDNLGSGNYNVAIGSESGTAIGTFSNTVSIGNKGWQNAASNQVFIGNSSTNWIGGWKGWSTFTADARIKNNVGEDVKGLDFITRLHPLTYHISIKATTEITGNKEIGDYPEKYDVEKVKYSVFLAQEVEQAAKDAGYDFSGITIPKNSNDLYSISYEAFVVPLVKAVQEQQAIIDHFGKKVDNLEMNNEELMKMNLDLMKRIELLEKRK